MHLFWEASPQQGAGDEHGEGAAWGLLGWELGKPTAGSMERKMQRFRLCGNEWSAGAWRKRGVALRLGG